MEQQKQAADRVRATESKFYLPAGVTGSVEASPFERLRAALFDKSGGPPSWVDDAE